MARQPIEEKRRYTRFSLTGNLPGLLRRSQSLPLEALPVDVSSRGLGLLVDPAASKDDVIELVLEAGTTDERVFRLLVRWAKNVPIPGVEGMVRCGLELENSPTNQDVDLVEVLLDYESLTIEE